MQTAGIIIEYNPLHLGHLYLLEEIRHQLGRDTAIVGVMSGNFVQRGDFALAHRLARARAAAESGMDLVLELPLPWAISSAERFADGGVQILTASGITDVLAFGSECGDTAAIQRAATALLDDSMPARLKTALAAGVSFAEARQNAVRTLLPAEDAALLSAPNNILGIEYCKSILRRHAPLRPLTVKRIGDGHDESGAGETPSSTAIRELLRSGSREAALTRMAPAMQAVYLAEESAGRAPVFRENCERAVLARLRSLSESDFAALDTGREGLSNRLYEASRTAASVEEILRQAKTKRYAYTRLRRMILWAYLGLTAADFPEEVPYLRPLAANAMGKKLLAQMRDRAQLPVLATPADVRKLNAKAQKVFALEARATDLYALAYPDLSAAAGGSLWREAPVIL